MPRNWLTRFLRTARPAVPGRPTKFVRVAAERLEDRTVPAMFDTLTPVTFTGLHNNGFVTSGDWDKDGKRDIVMTNYGESQDLISVTPGKTITLAYGNGDGTFGNANSLPVGTDKDLVSFLAVGDLNNDGNPDIVTVQTNNQNETGTATVFLGSAVGAFDKTPASPISSGGDRPAWVGIADVTGDGKQDVIVVHLGHKSPPDGGGRNVTILKGDGAGGLSKLFTIDIALADGVPTAAAIAKIDTDDTFDLAVTFATVPPDDASPQLNGALRVYHGGGDGSFTVGNTYDSGGPLPISITAAEMDGNKGIDLVVANAGDPDANNLYLNFGKGTAVGVLRNNGNGNFGPTTQLNVGLTSAFSVSAADFNFDGAMDIAVASYGTPGLFGGGQPGSAVIYMGKLGTFGFTADSDSPYITADGAQYLVVDNFNDNPTPDIVVVHDSNNIVTLLNTVKAAAPTTTVLTPTPAGPIEFGQKVTLTATVSAAGDPTGTVTFFNGANPLGAPVSLADVGGVPTAILDSVSLPAGKHILTAKYSGDADFQPSTSAAVSFTVNPASTATTLVAAPGQVTFGQTVTFTATVTSAAGAPSGMVEFYEGDTKLGSGTLAAVGGKQVATFATDDLTTGPHAIVAKYVGAGNFAASTSAEANVTVSPSATTVTLSADPLTAAAGLPITFTATVSSPAGAPTGAVDFFEGTTKLGSGALVAIGGKQVATFVTDDLTIGSHAITAKYGANGNFAAGTSAAVSVTVGKSATTVTLTSDIASSLYSQTVTFKAVVEATLGNPIGPVTFWSGKDQIGAGVLATVGGQQVATFISTGLPVGTTQVMAKFDVGGTFLPGESSPLTMTVAKAATTVSVIANPNPSQVGTAVMLSAIIGTPPGVTASATGTVTFSIDSTTLGTAPVIGGVATFVTSALPLGNPVVTAVYDGDAGMTGSAGTFPATVTSTSPPGVPPTVPPGVPPTVPPGVPPTVPPGVPPTVPPGVPPTVPPGVPPTVPPGVPPTVPPGTPTGNREFGVGAGAGLSALARFYNPDGIERFSIDAFPGFTGGVRVTSADFNGDGIADLVVGTGPGQASRVMILDGATKAVLFDIAPFEPTFTGGVYVASGDLTGDGKPEVVISPDEGGGPRVRVFSGDGFGQVADFFGIDDPDFRGGARAAVGDVNGDGVGDLVVAAGFLGGPRVAGYSGTSLSTGKPARVFGDFFAFEETLRNGVFIAVGDLDGDGKAEVIAGGGPGGGPRVTAFSATALATNNYVPVANFFGGNPDNRGGIRVAARNLDNDDRIDLVVGDGTGAGSRVTAYLGKDIAAAGTPPEAFSFDAFPGFTGGVYVG